MSGATHTMQQGYYGGAHEIVLWWSRNNFALAFPDKKVKWAPSMQGVWFRDVVSGGNCGNVPERIPQQWYLGAVVQGGVIRQLTIEIKGKEKCSLTRYVLLCENALVFLIFLCFFQIVGYVFCQLFLLNVGAQVFTTNANVIPELITFQGKMIIASWFWPTPICGSGRCRGR